MIFDDLSLALYNSFLLSFTQDNMTSVTCEAVNAHSPIGPDFTLQWRVHVVPLHMSGQVFYTCVHACVILGDFCYRSMILILVAMVWTDYIVEEYIG